MNMLVIHTDGRRELKPIEGLKSLQDAVGGHIEGVRLKDEAFMYVNEEGKMRDLPFNDLATQLWVESYGRTDYIVGDVAIVGDDGSGDESDVPEWVVKRFFP